MVAERIEWFDVTVPAGTLKTAPIEVAVVFAVGKVSRFDLTIPSGHSGLTGFRLNSAHQQIIPFTPGSWIIGEDTTREYELSGYPDHGNWTVSAYNTDIYDHTFHMAFLVDELSLVSTAPARLIGSASLGGGAPVTLGPGPVQVTVPPGPGG